MRRQQKGARPSPIQANGPLRNRRYLARAGGICALFRNQKLIERVGTLALFEIIGGADQLRGPGIEPGIITEWLGEFLGAIDRGRLRWFG